MNRIISGMNNEKKTACRFRRNILMEAMVS
jgi:hypothetical protein